jgi:hypothetical protein
LITALEDEFYNTSWKINITLNDIVAVPMS